jgi:ATP-dependent phosphoenolpyruvate carboxykinase
MNTDGPMKTRYFEGGCYAKVINLTEENEPDIFRAKKRRHIRKCSFRQRNKTVDFEDVSITQNTRVSYPIYHIDNIQEGSIGENQYIFLTAFFWNLASNFKIEDQDGLPLYFLHTAKSSRN